MESARLKVLVPRTLANRCYLSEALLWVSVSRFPLADVTQVPLEGGKWAEIDTRESPDHMTLGIPLFLDTLTENDCMRAFLPPNPNNEARTWIEPERIRERLSWRGENRVELEQDLQTSIAMVDLVLAALAASNISDCAALWRFDAFSSI
jgi:hypothetical protein